MKKTVLTLFPGAALAMTACGGTSAKTEEAAREASEAVSETRLSSIPFMHTMMPSGARQPIPLPEREKRSRSAEAAAQG